MADFSNLIAIINAQIRANGAELITGPVLNAVLLDMVEDLGAHAGGAVNGFIIVDDIADLPDPGQQNMGYIVGTHMYLYVGTGGDTADGKYQDVGEFKGPPGAPGEPGVGFQSVTTAEDGTIVITLTSGDTITIDLNHEHPQYYAKTAESSQPAGGFLPDVVYDLGEISGSVTFALSAAVSGNVNHYFWMFDTGSTAPTVTWPSGITWADGSAPTPAASKHYEVSVLGGIAMYLEV